VAIVLTLLPATAFAAGIVQQRGALQAAASEEDPRFLLQILHELFGSPAPFPRLSVGCCKPRHSIAAR
jgi:hypothetical protein